MLCHNQDNLSLDILKVKSRLAGNGSLSSRGQVLPLLALGDTLSAADNLTRLATLLDAHDLNDRALLHRLLEVGNHVDEDLLLVESELALEHGAGVNAGLEGLLQLLDEGHGALGLGLRDGFADGAHVEGHVAEVLAHGLDDAVLP